MTHRTPQPAVHTSSVWRTALAALALAGLAPTALAEKFTVVQVAPLSGLEATVGRAYSAGLQLALDTATRQGAGGHSYTLVRADDHHRAEDTLSETKRLVAENKPLALAGYIGDEGLVQVLRSGLLEQEKLSVIGYRVRGLDPEHPNLFSVRAGTRLEIAKLLQHLQTVGIQRVALFHEEGAGEVVEAVEAQCKELSLRLVAKAAYPAGSARASAAATQLQQVPQAQAILMVSSSSASAAFIEAYRSGGGTAQLFAHSSADLEQLAKRLSDQHTRNLAIAQVVPNPYRITLKLTREFNALAAAQMPDTPVSFAMMEGYIAGRVIVEAVRRQGGRASREGMAAALEGLSALDLDGYRVGYAPGQHIGARQVELTIVSNEGRIRQ